MNTETITKETSQAENIQNLEFYNIDACFMLDATGSMQPSIDMARDKIKSIITELRSQYSDAKVRIAVVAYRDVKDKNRFEIFPFDDSLDAAHVFLGSIQASGGADHPEDVNGGFRKALDLKWGEVTTKMIYHLADAPCHGGKRFHDSADHYPKGLDDDEKWEDIFMKLYQKDINYLYFDIEGTTKKMFNEFKGIYESCGNDKSHLIFNYEELHFEKNQKNYYDLREKSLRGMSDMSYEPSDKGYMLECYSMSAPLAHEKFSTESVKKTTEQRMKNVTYRSPTKKF